MPTNDLLFYRRGHLRDALAARDGQLKAQIESTPDEHLLQADAEEWADALAESFAVPCPVLKLDQMYRDKVKEIQLDVSGDRSRYFSDPAAARRFPGNRVVVHIPFEGEADVFSFRPSQFTLNPPQGAVSGDELILTMDYARDVAPNIDGHVNTFVSSVEQWLGFARGEIDPFNGSLRARAISLIEGRRQQIEVRDAHLATSSIPEGKPTAEPKAAMVDAIVRRPAPKLPSSPRSSGSEQAVELVPGLAQDVYEHILGLLRAQGLSMEKSPATYAQLGEEDRRNTILTMLNTHYEGRAAAEAFNGKGKTDILIQYDGINVFICECKFWQGVKAFTEAIDQLFGYTTWRDTKLSLVLFVKERGLTEVIEKARKALAAHPQFSSEEKAASKTELRARMTWPGDPARLLDLNITFIHTPEQ